MQEGSYHPRYMLRMSRVDLFWLAELSELADAKLQLKVKDRQLILEPSSAAKDLVDAVRVAGEVLKSEGSELEVVVNPRCLRVRIIGGTWLGGKFGERIAEGIAFTERLTELLSAHYKPLDPDAWKVTEGFEVVAQ